MDGERKVIAPQVCYHCGSFHVNLLNEDDGKFVFKCADCGKVWIKNLNIKDRDGYDSRKKTAFHQ